MTSSSTEAAWWHPAGPAASAGIAGARATWLAGGGARCPGRQGPDPEAPARVVRGPIWPELRAAPPSHAEPAPEPPPHPGRDPELTFTEAEMAGLCARAAARAVADALAAAGERRAEERLRLDGRLVDGLAALAGAVAARRDRVRAEAAALGAGLGRALAREALAREPLAAAGEMLAELLPELRDEPEVAVAVSAAHADELRADLSRIAGAAGRPGLLEVRADPALRAGEVRLTWRDGWAERLLADIEARADAALAALTGDGRRPGAVVETVELTEGIAP